MADIEEIKAKLLKKRQDNANRQRVFHNNQKLVNPNYKIDKALAEKKRRDVLKIKNKEANDAIKADKEAVKLLKYPLKPEIVITNTDGFYTDQTGMLVLNIKYFDKIDYSNIPIPQWKDNVDNRVLSPDVITKHIRIINIIYTEYLEIEFENIKPIIIKVFEGVKLDDDDIIFFKENDSFLSDSENFKKHILFFAKEYIDKPRGQTPSLNTFIDYLKPIINVLSRIETDDFYKNYIIISNTYKHLQNIYTSYKNKNIIKTDATGKKRRIDYNNKTEINKLMRENLTTSKEKAIASCYLYFPTRRLQDYANMKVVRLLKDTSDKEYNFIVIDKNNKIKQFVFNKYKTFDDYKTQRYDLKDYKDLTNILQPYTSTIAVNTLLFPNNNNIIDTDFSNTVISVFTKMYKIHLTLADIRNSAETFNNETPGRSLEVKIKFSNMMAHSHEQGLKYIANN
jgi:hypothetical protein